MKSTAVSILLPLHSLYGFCGFCVILISSSSMSVHKQWWEISKMNLFFQAVFHKDLVPVLALLQVQVLILGLSQKPADHRGSLQFELKR